MANNHELDIYSVCNPKAQKKALEFVNKIKIDSRKQKRKETPLSVLQTRAAEYFVAHYTREERYLIIFARDFAEHLNSAKWLQSEDGRANQKSFDFVCQFEELKEKMKEFRWSKEFLKENGIDFNSLKKLYFALA